MANADGFGRFPDCHMKVATSLCFNHAPLVVTTKVNFNWWRRKRFRFENSWLLEPGLPAVVQHSWHRNGGHKFIAKLDDYRADLVSWGSHLQRDYGAEIKEIESQLVSCRDRIGQRSDASMKYARLRDRLNVVIEQEELNWKQRSNIFLLQNGDIKSRFFHLHASTRRRNNQIASLRVDNGEWVSDRHGMNQIVKEYFEDLFAGGISDVEPVISKVRTVVTAEKNRDLLKPFEVGEFRKAVFKMHQDKSSGPDGFNSAFYQKFWHLIGDDVVANCKDWFATGTFPEALCKSVVVLIPKISSPESLKDFRPTSLCNVIYKVVSNVLANRLKVLLPRIISEYQSAFVPGMLITDNILVAFELIHIMKRKSQGSSGIVALKMDIRKAYDRVDWFYLESIMLKLGFNRQWVDLMLMCVKNVEYLVKLNDQEVGPIVPHQSLRQGDPLSPYLLILCAEGLPALMKHAEQRGQIHRCRASVRGPRIPHLLFADDSLFFSKADERESPTMKNLLVTFETASSQSVNYEKSNIFFSPNVTNNMRSRIQTSLNVDIPMDHGHYLGLPSLVGRNKKVIFAFIRDKQWRKIQNWKNRFLSRAAKEVLLKSVAQAIPTFCMSVFLVPVSIYEELQKRMNSFWWGSNSDGNKGVKWMAWDRLCLSKRDGGLRFRNLKCFKMAMLEKQ